MCILYVTGLIYGLTAGQQDIEQVCNVLYFVGRLHEVEV